GLVSALQVMQCCVCNGKTLAQQLSELTLFPQTLINVRLAPGQDWKQNTRLTQTQADIERQLGETGRVLIRASGTEPLLRVMVEARDPALANRLAQQLADAAKAS
ncbi:MAG: phosphoglucosamine mutase, partial [Comamonadaceae bacterium]|nr:phosphoglucosamine mutase [Comamonadaceae bacterium]